MIDKDAVLSSECVLSIEMDTYGFYCRCGTLIPQSSRPFPTQPKVDDCGAVHRTARLVPVLFAMIIASDCLSYTVIAISG